MRACFQIDERQVQDMALTIEITMTVDEWRNLMRQLSPGGPLGFAIAQALGHVSAATAARLETDGYQKPKAAQP